MKEGYNITTDQCYSQWLAVNQLSGIADLQVNPLDYSVFDSLTDSVSEDWFAAAAGVSDSGGIHEVTGTLCLRKYVKLM